MSNSSTALSGEGPPELRVYGYANQSYTDTITGDIWGKPEQSQPGTTGWDLVAEGDKGDERKFLPRDGEGQSSNQSDQLVDNVITGRIRAAQIVNIPEEQGDIKQKILVDEVSLLEFGAPTDGTTNSRSQIIEAITWCRSQNRTLHIPEGYTFVWNGAQINITGGSLKFSGKGTIKGSGKISTDFFKIVNADVFIKDVTFRDFRRLLDYENNSFDSVVNLWIKAAQFYNFTSVVRCVTITPGANAAFGRIVVEDGSIFSAASDGNLGGMDFQIRQVPIQSMLVTGSFFQKGGTEAFNCEPPKALSGQYIFDGNLFENYTNNLGGSDNDCHFIRCQGSEAVISNNIFRGLYVGSGLQANDTEAIRPSCHNITIIGNRFLDAGMGEGVMVMKESDYIHIAHNVVRFTDEYRAEQVARGGYGCGILSSTATNLMVVDNEFYGVNGAVVDFSGGATMQSFVFRGNKMVDCPCNQYSSYEVALRLPVSSGSMVIEDNQLLPLDTTNPTGTIPKNWLQINNASREVYCRNNHIWVDNSVWHVLGGVDKFISKGDRIFYAVRLGTDTQSATFRDIIIEDLHIDRRATSLPADLFPSQWLHNANYGRYHIRWDKEAPANTIMLQVATPGAAVCAWDMEWTAYKEGTAEGGYHHKQGVTYRDASTPNNTTLESSGLDINIARRTPDAITAGWTTVSGIGSGSPLRFYSFAGYSGNVMHTVDFKMKWTRSTT